MNCNHTPHVPSPKIASVAEHRWTSIAPGSSSGIRLRLGSRLHSCHIGHQASGLVSVCVYDFRHVCMNARHRHAPSTIFTAFRHSCFLLQPSYHHSHVYKSHFAFHSPSSSSSIGLQSRRPGYTLPNTSHPVSNTHRASYFIRHPNPLHVHCPIDSPFVQT